jgi:hypothetical protein
MRNTIPKIKTVSKEILEELEDLDDGRLLLIKSDNPNFKYEVYHQLTGIFLGYMGKIKKDEIDLK